MSEERKAIEKIFDLQIAFKKIEKVWIENDEDEVEDEKLKELYGKLGDLLYAAKNKLDEALYEYCVYEDLGYEDGAVSIPLR